MPIALTLIAALVIFAWPAAATGAAPDPGGNESAAVPLPPPGKYLGFNEGAVGGLHGLSSTDNLELARAIGGNTMRTNIDWRHAEPVAGRWDEDWWNAWRVFYEEALNRGMTPLFNVGFAPGWARDPEYRDCPGFGACEYPPARSHDADWSRYVREVARRFPRAIIEVWNEANLRIFWESGADPERFAELQVLAYDAIKEVSPSTLVLAGGLGGQSQTADGNVALREFVNRAYEAEPSIRGHMDAISLHPYPWSFELGAGSLFAAAFDDVRVAKAAHGDAGLPLFITEVGLPAIPGFVTEAQQADSLMRIYRRAMTMDDVLGVVFHRTIEPKETSANPIEWWFAWTLHGENPPVPRTVFCAFVTAAERSYPGCSGELPMTVRLGSAPSGSVAAGAVRFEFESPNYSATYKCSVNGGSPAPCWSPATYTLPSGRNSFEVRAHGPGESVSSAAKTSFNVRRK